MYRFTFFVGLLLLVSPYIYGIRLFSLTYVFFTAAGLLVSIISILEERAEDKDAWGYSILEVIGLIAMIIPYTVSFNGNMSAIVTSMSAGFLLIVISGLRQLNGRMHY